jgi:hypothetical protein
MISDKGGGSTMVRIFFVGGWLGTCRIEVAAFVLIEKNTERNIFN